MLTVKIFTAIEGELVRLDQAIREKLNTVANGKKFYIVPLSSPVRDPAGKLKTLIEIIDPSEIPSAEWAINEVAGDREFCVIKVER